MAEVFRNALGTTVRFLNKPPKWMTCGTCECLFDLADGKITLWGHIATDLDYSHGIVPPYPNGFWVDYALCDECDKEGIVSGVWADTDGYIVLPAGRSWERNVEKYHVVNPRDTIEYLP